MVLLLAKVLSFGFRENHYRPTDSCHLIVNCKPDYPLMEKIVDIGLLSFMERSTPQREAIRALFTLEGDPLSPQEILDQASTKLSKLSLATVYRTVRALVEANEIVSVDLPGESARYELAGKAHHHHFRCENCQRAFDVNKCPGNIARMTPEGFEVHRHEITLYGICRDCKITG